MWQGKVIKDRDGNAGQLFLVTYWWRYGSISKKIELSGVFLLNTVKHDLGQRDGGKVYWFGFLTRFMC